MWLIFCFEVFRTLCRFWKCRTRFSKYFLNFEKVAFALVLLNTRFYWEKRHFIGCQYVNKQYQDFRYTKTEFFVLIFFLNHKKIWKKYCRAEVRCGSDILTCWLCISVLTRGFLGISVTVRFAVYNFRNKYPLRLIFFFPSIANFKSISEMRKKIQKGFFDFEIFAFELVALGTPFYWETIHFNTCQYVNKQSQDFRYY